MATDPLSVCFPKPIRRGMSFRIYRLAEKKHMAGGEKRAFAQTITTPGGRDWRGWPGRNGQAGQLESGRDAHRKQGREEAQNSNPQRRPPPKRRRNSSTDSISAGWHFLHFS